jgi:tetratricopeptide (TPR) repeat protein
MLEKSVKNIPNRKYLLLALSSLCFMSLIVYFNSLFGEFVCDDWPQIVNNKTIREFRFLPLYFKQGVWSLTEVQLRDSYRPLFPVVLLLTYKLWGLNPFGFHLTNLLFHTANSILVFLLLQEIIKNRQVAPYIGALLFALYPVHVESVSWISGLPDPLSVFFFLLAFIFYLQYRKTDRADVFLYSLLFLICSLLSKEVGILFPGIIAVYDYLERRKIYFWSYIVFSLVIISYFVLIRFIMGSEGVINSITISSSGVVLFFEFFVGYLKLLFIPWPLHFYFSVPDAGVIQTWGIIFSLLALTILVLYSLKVRESIFALSWLLLTLLPPLMLAFRDPPYYAVRYLYLPSIGIAIILASVLASLKIPQRITITLASIVIIVFSIIIVIENRTWKDDNTFYSKIIKTTPSDMNGYIGLARHFERSGRNDEVINVYLKAVENVIDKDAQTFAYGKIALLYGEKGLTENSISYYKKVRKLNPRDSVAFSGLGTNFLIRKDFNRALKYFKAALNSDENNYEARYNLALTYENLGERDDAYYHYKRFLSVAPSDKYEEAIQRAETFASSYLK